MSAFSLTGIGGAAGATKSHAGASRTPAGRFVRALLTIMPLTALGCAAPLASQAADTCEMRFDRDPGKIVTYSQPAESGERTVRVDLCRGRGYGADRYDPQAIPMQIDEYVWDPESERWRLTDGSPRVQAGPCASFTEGLNIGAAAAVEQLLCGQLVSPEEEAEIFKVTLHAKEQGCWICYDPDKTIWNGTFSQEVYCQTPDYSDAKKRVHLDAYLLGAKFLSHLATFVCPNVDGLTPSQVNFLCGNKLPKRATCGN